MYFPHVWHTYFRNIFFGKNTYLTIVKCVCKKPKNPMNQECLGFSYTKNTYLISVKIGIGIA